MRRERLRRRMVIGSGVAPWAYSGLAIGAVIHSATGRIVFAVAWIALGGIGLMALLKYVRRRFNSRDAT